MSRLLLAAASLLLVAIALGACEADSAPAPRWFRGNTHTHTLWSDGDGAPELTVDWYASHGYDFLALTDHNQLQQGERWFPVGDARLSEERVEELRARFGEDAVEVREVEGPEVEGQPTVRREMRLVTLPELEARFEKPGAFELIQGEEITSHWSTPDDPPRNLPVHINAINLAEYVPPRGGETVADLLNTTLDEVAAQAAAAERPILAHLNHPNFGWGLTWRDVAAMRAERFFEVYNGHRGVRNEGDAEHPSTERMWDLANTLRVTELGLPLLYAVATDDAHNYHGGPTSQPGRGWVVVRAEDLSGDALVRAMKRGDFYASSGVALEDVVVGEGRYEVRIAAEEGVAYTTRFVGTRRGPGGPGPAGEVLLETDANPALFRFTGEELFVRAVVESSRAHPNPYREGDPEMAWAQPARP